MFGRGASSSRTRILSPLNRLRLQAGLSIPDLARRFGTTTATISRWVSGARRAPPEFVRTLHSAALDNVADVARAQEEYRQSLERRNAHARITVDVPPGLDPGTARKLCTEALVGALSGSSPESGEGAE